MIVWQAHGVRLRSTMGLKAKDSLVFECHDPARYLRLGRFPTDLEKGITLHQPNQFFLPFNAAMHLVNLSPLRAHLGSALKAYQPLIDHYFDRDPGKTLNVLFSSTLENAHAHGNKFDPAKKVVVDYEFVPKGKNLFLKLSVTDEGAGFDWKHLLDSYKQAKQSYHFEKANPNPHLRSLFPHAQGFALYSLLQLCGKVEFNEKANKIIIEKELKI